MQLKRADKGYLQGNPAAHLMAALVLKVDDVKDAKKHTKLIGTKSIPEKALLKLYLQQKAHLSTGARGA